MVSPQSKLPLAFPCYRRHAKRYRRLPIKLPSSVISDNFTHHRVAARLLYKNEERYKSIVFVQGVPYPHVSLLQIWERSVVAKRPKQAKTSRSERPLRPHLDDGIASPGCPQWWWFDLKTHRHAPTFKLWHPLSEHDVIHLKRWNDAKCVRLLSYCTYGLPQI